MEVVHTRTTSEYHELIETLATHGWTWSGGVPLNLKHENPPYGDLTCVFLYTGDRTITYADLPYVKSSSKEITLLSFREYIKRYRLPNLNKNLIKAICNVIQK